MYLAEPYYIAILITMTIALGISSFWLTVYFTNKRDITKKTKAIDFFPNVSIIIPAYNEEKNIGLTLKSIFSNDYPRDKMEVIVVNDGSRD